MTDDLITWLRAQLDEDEWVAKPIAETAPWAAYVHRDDDWRISDRDNVELLDIGSRAMANHIARQHPARVLAEVEAKRRLLEPHHDYGYGQCGECENDGRRDAPFPCLPARLLALPYADRPGYQEAWRP